MQNQPTENKRQRIEALPPPALELLLTNDDILRRCFSFLSVLDIRPAACANRKWHHVITTEYDLSLLFALTVPTTNEIVLYEAPKVASCGGGGSRTTSKIIQKVKVQPRSLRSRYIRRNIPFWPSCLALGPAGQLFVSQYKVSGVVEFKRNFEGYQYRRTVCSGPAFATPEGLVFAYDSLYVVSAETSAILRLNLDGVIIDRVVVEDSLILWGMSVNRDQSTLYVAAHRANNARDVGGDFRSPTRENTGVIIQVELLDGGSLGTLVIHRLPTLNRPTSPAFCSHGIMHLPTFVSSNRGLERRIYKFAEEFSSTGGNTRARILRCIGQLKATKEEDNKILKQVWAISFTSRDRLVATCHSSGRVVSDLMSRRRPAPSIFMTESCGCGSGGPPRNFTVAEEEDVTNPFDVRNVTLIATSEDFDQIECILPI